MRIVYDPVFLEKLKKVDVRIKKSVKERLLIFSKNPNNLELDNHPLREEYQGLRSIDVTADCRAIYREAQVGGNTVAYFVLLGTHEELYGKGERAT